MTGTRFSGLLAAIGFVVFIGVITYLTGYIIYTGVKSYAEQFGDWLSAFVILVPLVILIMFADDLTFISWNLVLIYLIIQGIYLVLFCAYTSAKRNKNRKFSGATPPNPSLPPSTVSEKMLTVSVGENNIHHVLADFHFTLTVIL